MKNGMKGMKNGMKGMKKGGKVGSYRSGADGPILERGMTKGTMPKMAEGGKVKKMRSGGKVKKMRSGGKCG